MRSFLSLRKAGTEGQRLGVDVCLLLARLDAARAATAEHAGTAEHAHSPLVRRSEIRVPIQLESHLSPDVRFSRGVKCFEEGPRDGHRARRVGLQVHPWTEVEQLEEEDLGSENVAQRLVDEDVLVPVWEKRTRGAEVRMGSSVAWTRTPTSASFPPAAAAEPGPRMFS